MDGIESQSELPDIVYVMLDRQSELDLRAITEMCGKGKVNYKVFNIHDIPDFVGRPHDEPFEPLFMVGNIRNRAIDMAIGDGCDCVVMIDGDCIPDIDLIKTHKSSNSLGYPNMSCGRRREEKHGDKDQREVDPKLSSLKLFEHTPNYIVHNPDLLKSCSVTWSCNFSMNLSAIKIIKAINQKYYGRDEVFNSTFLGSWGGEDSFIGIQAVYGKVFITIINAERSGIRHIDHPRPERKYGDAALGDYLLREIDYFSVATQLDPLDGEFYSSFFTNDK